MIIIDKVKWKPVDGIILEENALLATKSSSNMLVVAGPGAGKSELLAQRACYLLQTNECSEPHRILAVSFKKDAAANIEERVLKRCGKELGQRFDSMTFDAFAKSLLNQFINAIPIDYRPQKEYEIVNDDELIEVLKTQEIFNYKYKSQYKNEIDKLTKDKLPFSANNKLVKNLWDFVANTDSDGKCYLTFRMIGRLAEYLIRINPLLKKVLNMTYSHVFLDEYQDTTSIQYDLFKTCFYQQGVVVTAVGDDKQRIMIWAGALRDAFDRLIRDFNATEIMMVMNHRSAPRLLQIQKTLYKNFFYKNSEIAFDIVNNNKWNQEDGESYIHLFKDDNKEAEIISAEILKLIELGYSKRDICILAKQTPEIYCTNIINKLAELGIVARNEAKYQDLLKEDLINLLVNIMTIIVKVKSSNEWVEFIELFRYLNENNENDVYKSIELEKQLNNRIINFKIQIGKVKTFIEFEIFINNILEFIDVDKIKYRYSQYNNITTFKKLTSDYCELVWREYELCSEWVRALENFKGKDSIPIMTVHKSKGLEYECIFFVGLEDGAFWNFNNQRDEEFCAFFVALSRAKKRLDFTYCENRSLTRYSNQSKSNINEFYNILNDSEIVETIEYDA
ncbi:UvrD-helicase domain-containing protein [Clostridium tagluense]|uniref:UvrD-helicase domain-containing protein n=1 Tax=Clostridium tagluense TaxID=360422 RepID=UPI001C0B39D9|nr:ATP-dependent helicase [Clostridium tagluense]MBU3128484.1 ATP-dependent helicase [Clostridium tagluense]